MMRRWWLACLWCLALCSAFAQEPAGEIAIANEGSYLLSRTFTFLEDKEGRLRLDDVLRPEAQAAFRPVPQAGPGANFGLTRSAIWLRIKLKAQPGTPRDWLLEVAYPPLDLLEIYSPD
ncbi:MAG TPA: 7TM-DISM domain-containing protein, partial [Ramlibacter sp.]|nr:7TM-DISM domain-containing protein [Ramlibacter sp.]